MILQGDAEEPLRAQDFFKPIFAFLVSPLSDYVNEKWIGPAVFIGLSYLTIMNPCCPTVALFTQP